MSCQDTVCDGDRGKVYIHHTYRTINELLQQGKECCCNKWFSWDCLLYNRITIQLQSRTSKRDWFQHDFYKTKPKESQPSIMEEITCKYYWLPLILGIVGAVAALLD